MTSPNGPGGASRRPDAPVTRFADALLAPTPERVAEAVRREARLRAAVDAGWDIRIDPVRLTYVASRDMLEARDVDALLDLVEGVPREPLG